MYSNIRPAKHDSSNTSGTMSIINACVISLFISPVLDLNWRLDLVVKDRQQSKVVGVSTHLIRGGVAVTVM